MKGTKVGSYVIEEKIGEGGMGVVFLAKHARINQQAVVKVLHKHLADKPEMAKRFENEANAAASIGHPGIVQVFDIGQQDDGSLYIIMELLAGESLQDRLDRLGTLPIPQAIAIISQCADALAAAHATGIVHRDLKPDNIFLVPDSLVAGGERAKLLDFGIAKLQVEGMATMGTQMGILMGTPPYMSPEQCQGAGGVTHLSDIYALGCILFQLITGRTPFVGLGAGDYIVAHRTQAPPLLRTLAPVASQDLEEIVSNLLAKNPEGRFASAGALAAALDTLGARAEGQNANVMGTAQAQQRNSHAIPQSAIAAATEQPTTGTRGQPETTLGLSAGQGHETRTEVAQGSRGKAKVAVVGLLLATAAAAVAVVALGNNSLGPPAAKPAVVTNLPSSPVGGQVGEAQADARVQVTTVALEITLDPPDAEVLVDGKIVDTAGDDGGTPSKRAIDVQADYEFTLQVQSPGYKSFEKSMRLSAPESLAITLENPELEAKLLAAKERRSAWLQSAARLELQAAEESIAAKASFKTVKGKTKIVSTLEEILVTCRIVFGDDGNPKVIRECSAKDEVFRIKPARMRCSVSGQSLDCKTAKISAQVDEDRSVKMAIQVSRVAIEADASK